MSFHVIDFASFGEPGCDTLAASRSGKIDGVMVLQMRNSSPLDKSISDTNSTGGSCTFPRVPADEIFEVIHACVRASMCESGEGQGGREERGRGAPLESRKGGI